MLNRLKDDTSLYSKRENERMAANLVTLLKPEVVALVRDPTAGGLDGAKVHFRIQRQVFSVVSSWQRAGLRSSDSLMAFAHAQHFWRSSAPWVPSFSVASLAANIGDVSTAVAFMGWKQSQHCDVRKVPLQQLKRNARLERITLFERKLLSKVIL